MSPSYYQTTCLAGSQPTKKEQHLCFTRTREHYGEYLFQTRRKKKTDAGKSGVGGPGKRKGRDPGTFHLWQLVLFLLDEKGRDPV